MKKSLLFILFISLFIFGCKKEQSQRDVLNEFIKNYQYVQEDGEQIIFPEETNYKGHVIKLEWSLSEDILDENGYLIHGVVEKRAQVTLKATLGEYTQRMVVGIIVSKAKEVDSETVALFQRFKENNNIKVLEDENLFKASFPKEVEFEGKTFKLDWQLDKKYFQEDGTIIHPQEKTKVKVEAIVSLGNYQETMELIEVELISQEDVIDYVHESLTLPKEINDDIVLPKELMGLEIEWLVSDEKVLDSNGKCYYVEKAKTVTLTAAFTYLDACVLYDYEIVVNPYPVNKRLELAMAEIDIPSRVFEKLDLKETYSYGVSASWESSREDVISTSGEVFLQDVSVEVILKVKLYIGEEFMEKAFTVETGVNLEKELKTHFIVDRASDMQETNMNNLVVKDGKMQLADGAIYGYYNSDIYNTLSFDELVGSWAATSSPNATCELLVKIKVDDVWSVYYTYGIWGLGGSNLYYNQNDTNSHSKMSVDEVLTTDGKLATAFQYRLILRRTNKDVESAKVSLVSVSLDIPGYKYDVDVSNLPSFVDYDVPKVNQNVVPVIGDVICSATTTTMLLKYKGFNFADKDQYENRYIAGLVADRGHNSPTYGNWVYNTAVLGAFGLDAYVKRLYSWEELKWHLANVGPVGASISGDAILYKTGGHLIVARGYREVDGKTYVICNDPNINERFGNDKDGNPYFVYYEFPLETFMNFWRGVIYVVE